MPVMPERRSSATFEARKLAQAGYGRSEEGEARQESLQAGAGPMARPGAGAGGRRKRLDPEDRAAAATVPPWRGS